MMTITLLLMIDDDVIYNSKVKRKFPLKKEKNLLRIKPMMMVVMMKVMTVMIVMTAMRRRMDWR